jgi:hypothetical protein
MIGRFVSWLDVTGYESFDPYDLWGTAYGKWARRLYYSKSLWGLPFIAPMVLSEVFFPGIRGLFVRKGRYATADAQLILGFLNLCESKEVIADSPKAARDFAGSRDSSQWSLWLGRAEELSRDLLLQSIPGYRGHCWGYPFDWQNVNGLMPRHTPHITATPYCFEAFLKLSDATNNSQYLDIARSIATFVSEDLNETPTGDNASAGSYTPYDNSKVVNASAYRTYVLFEAARRFNDKRFEEKGWRNLRFILESQLPNGAWLYAIDNPREAFIDHFHTCFVLKNLHKANAYLRDSRVTCSIRKGYDYYRTALFDAQNLPRSYAIRPRLQLVRLEMYNVAEAIGLGALLRTEIPEAYELAHELARVVRERFQLSAGPFVTRVHFAGVKHCLPFLRWPQAQMFLALTSLLRASVPQHRTLE